MEEKQRVAVCLNNEGYEVSLDVGKLYRILPDADAQKHGCIRVVDESGEDYLFSLNRFFPLQLPQSVEDALLVQG
jgi:hypothetical protein